MKKPLVSIIIPVKDDGIYAVKLLKSLRKDPYENLEIIFIDDGSKDDSAEKIKNFALEEELRNVHLFRQEHEGTYAARNLGVEKSSGEYIIFLDPNDDIDKNFITALMLTTINGDQTLAMTGILKQLGAEKTKVLYSTLTLDKKPKETTKFYRERLFKKDDRLHFLNNKLFLSKIIKDHELKFEKPKKDEKETSELKFIKKYVKLGDIENFVTINKPLYILKCRASHRRS
ncbi:glycosyltransferase family 2 protein [Candidatus Saccharibacteria bacterium]|nr:glycosyltransferase family 2 protein [Candidatus Saccharibacteria bacterium]